MTRKQCQKWTNTMNHYGGDKSDKFNQTNHVGQTGKRI